MRVLFHYAVGRELSARLAPLGLDLASCPEGDDPALFALLPDAEVFWHVIRRADAAVMEAAPKLRLIQKIGVGLNTIDLDAARTRGIAVCNLPGTNSRAVAEHTLMLMLAALRRLPVFHDATRDGKGWSLDPATQDGLRELGGLTVGLIGYGEIPRILAPVLDCLGCHILYTARRVRPEASGRFVELGELLAKSDVVSLHIPLTEETAKLIDANRIARMKPGAVLVNTARGGLVDQAALAQALRDGHLGAAGLDTFADEPADAADPILTLPNVVLTPHTAWITTGTFDRSFAVAAENVRRLARGDDLLHRIL